MAKIPKRKSIEQNAGRERKAQEKGVPKPPFSRGRWHAEMPVGPIRWRLTRVTEGVAPRTHSTTDSFSSPDTNQKNRATRAQPPSAHIEKRFGGVRGETDESAKIIAETGVIRGRLPPSRGSGVGLRWRFGISARHLPLLRWRLGYAFFLRLFPAL